MTQDIASSELRRQLLERLKNGEVPSERASAEMAIQPAPGEEIPLSGGQRQVWLHSAFAPDVPLYNESITVRKHGPLDPLVLGTAFNEIVRRHAIWRTGFEEISGRILQVVHPELRVPLPFLDLSHLPQVDAQTAALRVANEDSRRIFDLAQPPLLRGRILRISQVDHRLYLTFHHLVFDGVSIYQVFLPELMAVYDSFLSGRPSSLPELRIQYGDFAIWQNRKLLNGDYGGQLQYWRDTLKNDLTPPKLATHARHETPSWQAGMHTFALPPKVSRQIKQIAAEQGVSLYMTLLATFHVLLFRYSGQEEISTGAVVSTRSRPETEKLIGFLLNTLVIRSRVAPKLSFREFLDHLRNAVLDALANSDIPFDTVVRELAPKRGGGRNGLFEALFSLRPAKNNLPEGWELNELDVHSGASGFDLFVDLVEKPETLTGRVIYSCGLFDAATIARMTGHFQTLLEAICVDPDLAVSKLTMLPEEERKVILKWGAGPSATPRASTISALLEEVVCRAPDRIAVVFERQGLTFAELDRRAAAFSAELRNAGARPGILISVSVNRSVEMLIALVGILKTGAAYLPIDSSLPKERRDFLLMDARPHLQVASTALNITVGDREPSDDYAGLAYVLYTSGSTGVPKGVEVPHSAAVNLLCSMQREPGFSSSDTLLAVTTLSFDIAFLELFLPLISGGVLVIAPRETVTDPQRLIEAICDSSCTVMQGTPAMWRSLIEAGWSGSPQMRILCGGEALPRELARSLLSRSRELWNMYGPTETTVWSTVQRVESGDDPVSIGHPVDNTQIYVLDRQRRLLPAGLTGELYIGGSGVARGYICRRDLTNDRFLAHPFESGRRIYRTGDLARWEPAGRLEFLGRADNQVKIRGHRVELQEVEEALLRYTGIRAAAVKAWRDTSSENTLVAYLVGTFDASALRDYLARVLPSYMIPTRFVEKPSLPLTPNGKLDRNALPEPEQTAQPIFHGPPVAVRDSGTERERRVAAIWAELLNLSNPGMHDDFFDLGGHSLLATTLLRRIEVQFGKRLSISALFENPTIAGLSSLLASDTSAGDATNSTARRLHWMYAGAYCRDLARHLLPEYQLYGVSVPEEIENKVSCSNRLEDVGHLIVSDMRSQTHARPYNLAGWCISGILAYEVAVQLEALGEELGTVALVGAPNPQHYTAIPRGQRLKSKLQHHWSHLMQLDAAEIPHYLLARARHRAKERSAVQSRPFERTLLELALRYRPKPLKARVILFQGVDRPAVVDYAAGWAGVVKGEFAAYDVPGDHVTSLEEPNVEELARKMKEGLQGGIGVEDRDVQYQQHR